MCAMVPHELCGYCEDKAANGTARQTAGARLRGRGAQEGVRERWGGREAKRASSQSTHYCRLQQTVKNCSPLVVVVCTTT
jgi:hypothetical protein